MPQQQCSLVFLGLRGDCLETANSCIPLRYSENLIQVRVYEISH